MSTYINKEIRQLLNLKNSLIKKWLNKPENSLKNEKPGKGFFYPKEEQEYLKQVEINKGINLLL